MSFSIDIIFYTPFVFALLYLLVNLLAKTPRHVCIVVLGDIGRSPRMQYHALSFAEEGFRVYLVGYRGSIPHEKVLNNENIQIHHVREPPAIIAKMPRIVGYFFKVIWQSISLAFTLFLLPKMSSILIQNPPSIPTMFVSYLVCCIRFSDLVIDWHNYGHTILAMALRQGHPMVKFAKWYEKKCGRLSSHNICVTHAMKEDLQANWGVRALTVHDRPSDIFQSIDAKQQHDLFTRLSQVYPVFSSRDGAPGCTKFTKKDVNGVVAKLESRPALLVSSTSWTEDEDFGILLTALEAYDSAGVEGATNLPELVCVITGKGPQKTYYSQKIEERKWNKVKFCLPWLAAEDYPLMLGSADIGVCLHKSSSGLDLPMKVVDMFGCGLPVCAVNFSCIGELVQHDKNGLIFNDGLELQKQLTQLLQGFPHKTDKLDEYRKNLASFQEIRWHGQWKQLVLPIFQEIGGLKKPKPEFRVRDLFEEEGGLDNDNSEEGKKDK